MTAALVPEVLQRYQDNMRELANLNVNPIRAATQAGLGDAIVDAAQGSAWYVPELKQFVYYDGLRYVLDIAGAMVQFTKFVVRQQQAAAESRNDMAARKALLNLETSANINGALAIAATDPRLVMRLERFDSDPWLLNAPAGLVDLRTGEIVPHAPEHLCMMVAGASPDYEAEAPVFERFMLDIADGRHDLAAWMIARMAYALTGDTSLQDLEIRTGSGSNGKGVVERLQCTIMGDYATTVEPSVILDDGRRGGPSPELLALRGRRLAILSESAEGERLNVAMIKRLSGGDQIVARALHSNVMVSFTPTAKFVLATNHRPRVPRVDYAIERRLRLVPFDRRFEGATRDPHILDRLLEERDAIMGRLVRGAQAYAASFTMPPCSIVASASAEYLADEDVVQRWISECAVLEPTATTPAATLYHSFSRWLEREGLRGWSAKALGTALKEKGLESFTSNGAYRRGIRLSVEGME